MQVQTWLVQQHHKWSHPKWLRSKWVTLQQSWKWLLRCTIFHKNWHWKACCTLVTANAWQTLQNKHHPKKNWELDDTWQEPKPKGQSWWDNHWLWCLLKWLTLHHVPCTWQPECDNDTVVKFLQQIVKQTKHWHQWHWSLHSIWIWICHTEQLPCCCQWCSHCKSFDIMFKSAWFDAKHEIAPEIIVEIVDCFDFSQHQMVMARDFQNEKKQCQSQRFCVFSSVVTKWEQNY